MSSFEKDYSYEHTKRFSPIVGHCWGCRKSIRACDETCPNCGATLQIIPKRWPNQSPEKLCTPVFEDDE